MSVSLPLTAATYRALSRAERSDVTAELLARAANHADTAERAALLDEVVMINLRVAHAVAARYRHRGVPQEDLEQVACEGLTKAVARYDAGSSHDLLSFAVPTIRGEVLRYFRDLSWTLRPPRRVQELQWRLNRCRDEMSARLGREPGVEEVCRELDITAAEHDEAVQAFGCMNPPSLDQPVGVGDDLTLGLTIADPTSTDGPVEARVVLAPLLRRLDERDRRLLHLRFVEDRTQQQIGDELGVPQVQVSRWLSRILHDLRRQLAADTPPPGPTPGGTTGSSTRRWRPAVRFVPVHPAVGTSSSG